MDSSLTTSSIGRNQGSIPDLSIVVVNWNTGGLLAQCLKSVISERGIATIEVFVVDNASTDTSLEAVSVALSDDTPVSVVKLTENLGFAKATNIGLRQSQGRYVLLLNPDTVILDKAIERIVRFLDAHPDAGAAGGLLLNLDGSIQQSCACRLPTLWTEFSDITGMRRRYQRSRLWNGQLMPEWDRNSTRTVETLSGAFLAVPAEVIQSVGMLDESLFMYAEDMDWCFRIRKSGRVLWFVHDARVIHYGGQSSGQVHVEMALERRYSDNLFFRKHYGLIASWLHRTMIRATSFALYVLLPVYRCLRPQQMISLAATREYNRRLSMWDYRKRMPQ